MGELSVGQMIMMVVICIAVSGTLAVILTRFLKKLRQIESEFWGENAERRGHSS